VFLVCLDLDFQPLGNLNGIPRDKAIALFLCWEYEREDVRFRSAKTKGSLLHAIRQKPQFTQPSPVVAEPAKQRPLPFFERKAA
jgi:hypothetical protein